MAPADVTVVIPTRERPDRLALAVSSVEPQTLERLEIVVVDDSSTAASHAANGEVLARVKRPFTLLAPLALALKGSGPSSSRNRGLRVAKGRYVAFLDDDDRWTWNDYLKTAVNALDATHADIFCADMQGFRGEECEIATWFVESQEFREQVLAEPPVHRWSRQGFVRATTRRVLHPNMLVIRRGLIESQGGFREDLRFGEDAEFGMRMADGAGGILCCPRVAARYRLPEADSHSMSMTAWEQDRQMLAAVRDLRKTARTSEVRHGARDVEGWTLRCLSRHAHVDHRLMDAFGLALQGLMVYPTAGALMDVLRIPFRRRVASAIRGR